MEQLKVLGLDENEIKVYLATLKIGPAKNEEIAKEAGIIRTTCHSILNKLKQKGIISNILKEKVNYFAAVDPEQLIEMLKEKQYVVESILPKLNEIKKHSPKEHKIIYFEGKEGVKTVIEDIISKKNRNFKVFGSYKFFNDISPVYANQYFRKKIERNIRSEGVTFKTKENLVAKKRDKKELRKSKFISEPEVNAGCFIYEDKVALVSYDKDGHRGCIIKDPKISKLHCLFFKYLWKNSKK